MIPSVKCALVTDLQGIVLLRAGSSTDEAALQQMAATFALTTDQANKLRLGKAKHFTLCYGALTEGEFSACLALSPEWSCDSAVPCVLLSSLRIFVEASFVGFPSAPGVVS